MLSTLTSGVVEVGRFIYNFVLGFIVSIYLLASRDKLVGRMKKLLYAFVNRDAANTTLAMAQKTNAMFKGFIVGKIVDSSIIGVLCFLGMSLLKLPYALFISVIVGVTNVIPYFGPFLGAIPSALLILIDSPIQCLIFSLFILFLQQLDGNFIGPKVLGNTTGLSSLGCCSLSWWGRPVRFGGDDPQRARLRRAVLPDQGHHRQQAAQARPAHQYGKVRVHAGIDRRWKTAGIALRTIAKGAHRQSAGQNAPRFACPPPAPAPDLRTGPGGRLAGARLRPSAGRENRRISRGN